MKLIGCISLVVLLTGCISTMQHKQNVQDDSADRITVGKVQREIRIGMTSAEVIEVLGSPNIVSTDEQRRENWVYDKIATDRAYSASSGGVSALIIGGLGAASGGVSQSTGASTTSQRTLTIIIKFDSTAKVRDFAYHTSRF